MCLKRASDLKKRKKLNENENDEKNNFKTSLHACH